ncbi:hypothetical protein PRUPE_7G014200 [Prunus persica]|uniref:CCHC-type domain-containing protein n=1 Tax=Prunus persica TaxID=3760 RepID=A0A251N744_PRUPE|nr:hypothetical protein PRUPE_7G014200 [Prunus persica]
MLFYLTTKKLASICTSDKPYASDNPTPEQTWALQTWIENDFLCKNYIEKYDTKEADAKKFAVSRYLKFQIMDEKSVEAQSHELHKILHEIIIEGMNLDEQFQVAIIIHKLPPSWKDFKNALRHKTKEFSLESLITRLHIEEEARKHDMKEEVLLISNNNKNHNSNRNQTTAALKTNGKNMKIKTGTATTTTRIEMFLCYNYHKPGHLAQNCRKRSRPAPQVNITE